MTRPSAPSAVPAHPFGPPDSLAHGFNLALLATLVLASLATFGDLPARIPVHFGLDGTPDRWADRSLGRWMVLPLVAAGSGALVYACVWLVGRFPNTMNVPDAARYRALTPAARGEVVSSVQRFLLGLTAVLQGLFLALQAGTWQVATGAADRLPWFVLASMGILIVGSPIGAVVFIVRISSLVRRLHAAENPSGPSGRSPRSPLDAD